MRTRSIGMSRFHRSRAQGLVEIALVLPLLAVLLTGVIEIGFLLYAHVQVTNAVREAARAASLYRSTRFSQDSNGNVIKCGGTEGWTLQQTIEQAVVRRVDNSGCPQTSGTVQSTSLGRLSVSTTPAWTITTDAVLNSDGNPTAGASAKVTLSYPYKLLIVSSLIPSLQDPMTIEKSVGFEFQQ